MKTLATHPELVRAWLLAQAGTAPVAPHQVPRPAPAAPVQPAPQRH